MCHLEDHVSHSVAHQSVNVIQIIIGKNLLNHVYVKMNVDVKSGTDMNISKNTFDHRRYMELLYIFFKLNKFQWRMQINALVLLFFEW